MNLPLRALEAARQARRPAVKAQEGILEAPLL